MFLPVPVKRVRGRGEAMILLEHLVSHTYSWTVLTPVNLSYLASSGFTDTLLYTTYTSYLAIRLAKSHTLSDTLGLKCARTRGRI